MVEFYFRHETSALRAGRGIIAAWVIRIFYAQYIPDTHTARVNIQFSCIFSIKVGQNRMLLLLLAYAAMLALIGMQKSEPLEARIEIFVVNVENMNSTGETISMFTIPVFPRRPSRRAFVENRPSNARIFVILPVYL